MSIIENNGIKRGDLLTSTAINAEFAAVNSAFPMDGDNVRSEGLDQPVFDTNPNSGQSGIILKKAETFTLRSAQLTITSNTNADSAVPIAATEVGAQSVVITAQPTDVLRVYWQYDFDTEGNFSAPYSSGTPSSPRNWVWAFWLEWKTQIGNPFTPVPGQGGLETPITVSSATKYGDLTSNLRACSLDTHAINYRDGGTSENIVCFPGQRAGYGQWFYEFPSLTTVIEMRLVCRGLYGPVYATTSNALKTLQGTNAHKIHIYKTELSYMLMRKK